MEPLLSTVLLAISIAAGNPPPMAIHEVYGRLPLAFEENRGQACGEALFLSRGKGACLFLTGTEAVLVLTRRGPEQAPSGPAGARRPGRSAAMPEAIAVRLRFVGADPAAEFSGLEPLPHRSSYFRGHDASKWLVGVPNYARVRSAGIYPGVDLVFHGEEGLLEYDLVLEAGADPRSIRIAFDGLDGLRLDGEGGLVLDVEGGGEVRQLSPRVYAEAGGSRRPLRCRHVLLGPCEVGFEVEDFDRRDRLVIDPILAYSTYLGGTNFEYGGKVAVDAAGSAYVCGSTLSADFPATPGSAQPKTGNPQNAFARDIFVAKLDPSGAKLAYATYLGGSDNEPATGAYQIVGIAVDASGSAYVASSTSSTDFPVMPGAFQGQKPSPNQSNGFVAKLSPGGDGLVYSTYLGSSTGGDEAMDIAVDRAGNAYIAGFTGSKDFPIRGGFQTTFKATSDPVNAFIAKLGASGLLVSSTFLGGSKSEAYPVAIALDTAGGVYVAGSTESSDFPIQGALQPKLGAAFGTNAFVAKLSPDLKTLVYSTYLGGSLRDGANAIAVDYSGGACVAGFTASADFPVTPGAIPPVRGGGVQDVFLSKIAPGGGALAYSTVLGGGAANAIAVDSRGTAFVAGQAGLGFPVTPDGEKDHGAFLLLVSPSGSSLLSSTTFGGSGRDVATGIALDAAGSVYLTGQTSSSDFPIRSAFQGALNGTGGFFGTQDAFVAKFAVRLVVKPDRGGDIGLVSAIVLGTRFEKGSTVKLSRAGEGDIPGLHADVSSNGYVMETAFDLAGKARGPWDVVVTSPAGDVNQVPGSFTIEEGRPGHVRVDLVGPKRVRAGRYGSYTITFGNENDGNVDVIGVPFWIGGIPPDATVKLGFEVDPPAPIPGKGPFPAEQVPAVIEVDGEQVVPLFLPAVPTGFVGSLNVSLKMDTIQSFPLRAWVGSLPFGSPPGPEAMAWFRGLTIEALDVLGVADTGPCVDDLFKADGPLAAGGFFEGSAGLTRGGAVRSLTQMLVSTVASVIECAKVSLPADEVLGAVKVALGG